jgi:hypothetical protein
VFALILKYMRVCSEGPEASAETSPFYVPVRGIKTVDSKFDDVGASQSSNAQTDFSIITSFIMELGDHFYPTAFLI